MTEAAGLAMPNLGTYVSCEEPELVEHAMKGVKKLGVPGLRVRVPNYDGIGPYMSLRDRAIGQYRDVEALAKQYGVKAMIEMHMNNIVPSASACAVVRAALRPRACRNHSRLRQHGPRRLRAISPELWRCWGHTLRMCT